MTLDNIRPCENIFFKCEYVTIMFWRFNMKSRNVSFKPSGELFSDLLQTLVPIVAHNYVTIFLIARDFVQ